MRVVSISFCVCLSAVDGAKSNRQLARRRPINRLSICIVFCAARANICFFIVFDKRMRSKLFIEYATHTLSCKRASKFHSYRSRARVYEIGVTHIVTPERGSIQPYSSLPRDGHCAGNMPETETLPTRIQHATRYHINYIEMFKRRQLLFSSNECQINLLVVAVVFRRKNHRHFSSPRSRCESSAPPLARDTRQQIGSLFTFRAWRIHVFLRITPLHARQRELRCKRAVFAALNDMREHGISI